MDGSHARANAVRKVSPKASSAKAPPRAPKSPSARVGRGKTNSARWIVYALLCMGTVTALLLWRLTDEHLFDSQRSGRSAAVSAPIVSPSAAAAAADHDKQVAAAALRGWGPAVARSGVSPTDDSDDDDEEPVAKQALERSAETMASGSRSSQSERAENGDGGIAGLPPLAGEKLKDGDDHFASKGQGSAEGASNSSVADSALAEGSRVLEEGSASARRDGQSSASVAASRLGLEDADPMSPETLEKARKMYSPYLKFYESALESGLARGLMPDPFGDAPVGNLRKPAGKFHGMLWGDELRKGGYAGASHPRSVDHRSGFDHRGRPKHPGASEPRPAIDESAMVKGFGCKFLANVDYRGKEVLMREGLTQQRCCELCVKMNKDSPGLCGVAVYSSVEDFPPRACWIKQSAHDSVRKLGVVSCLPQASNVSDAESRVRELEDELRKLRQSLPQASTTSADADVEA